MTAYYVDGAAGNDDHAGTAAATAWRSLDRVNRARFAPGDRILFAGGQTFPGTLVLKNTPDHPANQLTVASYGDGRATIDGGTTHGLEAEGCAGLAVRHLIVKGAGRKTGNADGRGVFLRKCREARIEDVEAYGFQKAGIEARECEDVRIERCHAHENGFAGIHVNGRKIVVTGCRAINNAGDPAIRDNHSGNGILLSSADDSVVEYCEAAGNGWDQPKGGQPNGPVGIWCHDSARVTIQYCIAHHNKSTSGDGGGFDFDGGTRDSVLQYNYSYENHSSGYLIWEYGSQFPIKHNVIRHNVSVNDGEAGIRMGKSGGMDVEDLLIEHNTIINDRFPAILSQGTWDAKWQPLPEGGLKDVVVRKNILIGPKGGAVVGAHGPLRYEDNLFWSFDGTFTVGGAADFAAWAKGRTPAPGIFADPKLADPKLVPQLTDPARLGDLATFAPAADSPAAGRGVEFKKLP